MGLSEQEIEKLIHLNQSDFDYREWLPLKYAQDWAFLNGSTPQGKYVADYHSHYSEEQRAYFLKIMRMMRFMNSLGNTLSFKSRQQGRSAACIIENHDYSRKKEGTKEEKNHANVKIAPPLLFIIVLAAGLLLNLACPLDIMTDPGIRARSLAIWLFILAGIVQAPTILLMLRNKTALRPDRETTTLITTGFFKYSRNPLYLSLIMIFCGIALYNNLLWLIILVPVLFGALERAVICHEEKYLERLFDEEYIQYKKKVRRWI